ncbi:MAG TPA: hypothetical protein VNW04_00080 [Puia sp.]|jgi:hypothetical protein|nr:hypothetical protein [Puia sp.]
MTGEFKIQLKKYDQAVLTRIFNQEYHGKLGQAYSQSAYNDGKIFTKADFCSGTITAGSLLLIYTLQADTLMCYVETEVTQDLGVMKKAINTYFGQVISILDKNKIKWHHPEATIKLEKYPFYGYLKTLPKRIRAIFDEKWEKLLLSPIASILASYCAIRFNLLDKDEYIKDVKKAVILTIEAYIGLTAILIIQILFKANKKEFTFNI